MAIDNKDLSVFLETATVAARLAGQRAIDDFGYVKASQKSADELVTASDSKCQQIIIDTIKRDFSDHGIIGEEGKDGKIFKQPPRSDCDLWWVIDPIDGTNNFANGILNFAVSIGIIHQGRPIVGVIYDPCTDTIFTASAGSPPQCNSRRIQVNQGKINRFESIGMESYFANGCPEWVVRLLEKSRCRALGTTATHLAYVAKGSFIAAISMRPKLWDIAAGACLIEASGGIVTDWQGNSIWPMDMENYQGQTIKALSSNKAAHAELIGIINGK